MDKTFEFDSFQATMICEGEWQLVLDEEPEEALVIRCWQYLIDTGLAFSLQGYFGRTAHRLIDAGLCTPPTK